MTMAPSYNNYELSISQGLTASSSVSQHKQIQSNQHHQIGQVLKKPNGSPYKQLQQLELSSFISSTPGTITTPNVAESIGSASNYIVVAKNYNYTPKNYFVPLHVDCSVEYELPKQPRPPSGKRFEPLLMIHPCYFRKMESQRRGPFINNMPNSSRNSAMFVGLALVSQESNISSRSSPTYSYKKTPTRNHQHHYNTRQNFSSHYGPIVSSDEHNQFQNLPTRQQHRLQNNLTLMPQQNRYSEGNAQFLDDSSASARRNAITVVNRTNNHQILSSTLQTKTKKNQQELLVKKSSYSLKSAADQWNQSMAAPKSSIADTNLINFYSASINNPCDTADCSIVSSSALGKRDAMISGSGSYSNNSSSIGNNIALQIQMNSSTANNMSTSSEKKQEIMDRKISNVISTCLIDTTKVSWSSDKNIAPSLLTNNPSPLPKVPSNFQAGPDTSPPTKSKHYKCKNIIDNNSIDSNNKITNNNKFRHYLRSHRVHPYLTGTSSHTDNLALSSKSTVAARGGFEVLPKFSAAKSGVTAMTAVNSFQQNIQQCVIKLQQI